MIAITVDDERPMLTALTDAVSASPDIDAVTEFNTCTAAVDWVKDNSIDIAFLDINMRGMGGLALAEKLIELCPDCRIIFCTGYAQYALDAIQLHVSGYLMKPITAEAVQKELDHITGQKANRMRRKLISVKCFGSFEALAGGKPLNFKRTKSKELLALLIDRNGAGITARQICAKLWEDDDKDGRNLNYLHQLFSDLRFALELAEAGSILRMNGYSYALDTGQIDCDYYSYLKTGKPEFSGEYMSQYSWAEETCGFLSSR